MRSTVTLFLASILLTAVVAPVGATFCAQDVVPAASLLIPHFEVDLDRCERTTEVTVTNAKADTVIAHVTVWTDLGVPALDFDLYLTGFDVHTFDLGQVLCDGNVPQTGAGVSPHGPLSEAPVEFPSCNSGSEPGAPPVYQNPAISEIFRDHLHAWLTGRESVVTGNCAGFLRRENVARGYVTIDVVRDCTLAFPTDPGYFTSKASKRNALLGEYAYRDFDAGTAAVFPAVHLEATRGPVEAGKHTFYGRYVGASGGDGREALSSKHAARFGASTDLGTPHLLVWREHEAAAEPFPCNELPLLPEARVTFFDEEENAVRGTLDLPCQTNLYFATDAGGPPFESGWMRLDLSHDEVVYGDGLAQGWATTLWTRDGSASGAHAAQLDKVCGK